MSEETLLHSEFVLEVLSTILYKKSKDLLEIVIHYLKPSFIGDDNLRIIFNEMRNEYIIEKKLHSIGTLKLVFRKQDYLLDLLDQVRESVVLDEDVLLDQLEKFVKNCKFIEVFNTSVDSFNLGEKEKAYKLFEVGAQDIVNFSIRKNAVDTLFHHFTKRNIQRMSGANRRTMIPMFIDELQVHTGGGETGKLTMFLADAKMGKSYLLAQQSVHCARMAIPTLHWFLEGTKEENLERMDGCFLGATLDEIKNNEISEKKFAAHLKIMSNIGKGEVYMRFAEQFNAVTMYEIRQSVIDLKKQGIDIKAVGIDYTELAEPGDRKYSASEEKARQQAVVRMQKNLATEQNVWVYSATQASSIDPILANDPSVVLTRRDLSDDKGKIRPVDALITLNQTKDEKKNRIMRLFIDGIRNREGDNLIYIATAFHRNRFYDRKRTLNEFFTTE